MAKAFKTSPEGRKCRFPMCAQTLSIYNHKDYCRLHWDKENGNAEIPYRHPKKTK